MSRAQAVLLCACWLILAALVGHHLLGNPADIPVALNAWCGGVVSALIVVGSRR